MAEYIEREKLPQKKERGFILDDDFSAGWNACLNNIKNIPAADVRPVVKAKIVDMRYTEDDGEWKCSRCGWQFTLCVCGKDVTSKIHFCPNCGADMREED